MLVNGDCMRNANSNKSPKMSCLLSSADEVSGKVTQNP